VDLGAPVTGNANPTEIFNAMVLHFVLEELDLGTTFCDVALCANDLGKKERNSRNARRAYESALHFLPRLNLACAEHEVVQAKVSRLNDLLEQLDLRA
jgi:hypothetical protein